MAPIFGVDRICRQCSGKGGEHTFHMDLVGHQINADGTQGKPIMKRRACTEHPCRICGGKGTIKA